MASDRETRRIQTRARVQVTLDIEVGDCWGVDCPTGQVFDQAAQAAIEVLRGVFNLQDGLVSPGVCKGQVPKEHQHRVRIIGVPDVTAITSREAKS